MKKRIIIYILYILTTFTFVGCSGIHIGFDSDNKTAQGEDKQQQNTGNKSQTAADKAAQGEAKQGQNTKDNSPVTVNINEAPQANNKPDVVIVKEPSHNGSFVFWNSNSAYLTKNQVYSLSNYQLGIARNEIYARHGYIFSTEKYRAYFNAQGWYSAITTNVTLNNIETYNVDLIKAEEDRRGVEN